jgi:hypothetical protein
VVQQAPQGAAGSAKLAHHLRQRPRLGDQPVQQVGPDALEAELGGAGGDALVGGVLALVGQLLAAGRLGDAVGGDGTVDGSLGGGQVAGEPGDAPAVIDEGLQAAAEVGETQPRGLLVERAVTAAVDAEPPLIVRRPGKRAGGGVSHALGAPGALPLRETHTH